MLVLDRLILSNLIVPPLSLQYGSMNDKEKSQIVAEVNILRELRHPCIVRYYDRIIEKKVRLRSEEQEAKSPLSVTAVSLPTVTAGSTTPTIPLRHTATAGNLPLLHSYTIPINHITSN